MADEKISVMTTVTPATGDLIEILDVSDTTQSASGSTRRATVGTIAATGAPQAHATTHKSGGSDAVKLDELAAPTDITTLNASTTAHGLLPKLSNVGTQYLSGLGTWTTPAGGGGGGLGGAFFLVAASNAHATIKARADYVCDGVADQTEINAALALGPTMLSGGIFTISAPIAMLVDGSVLRGVGGLGDDDPGTSEIRLAAAFAGIAAVSAETSTATVVARCVISGLRIKGSGSVTANVDGISFRCYQGVIHDCAAVSMTGNGFRILGTASPAWSPYDTRVYSLHAYLNTGHGLHLGTDCHAMGSVFHDNGGGGIYMSGASAQITQVHCYGNLVGIHFYNGGGVRTKISNCKIEHSGQHGIWLQSDGTANASSVQISNNGFNCNGKNTNNTYSDIAATGVQQANNLQVVGNMFGNSDGVANQPQYNLNMGSICPTAIVANNRFSNFVTAAILMSGTTVDSIRISGNYNQDDFYGSLNPTAAMLAASGTTPPAAVVNANSRDTRGYLTHGTGTGPTAGDQVTVSFANTRTIGTYRVSLNPMNTATANLNPYVSATTTTGFTIAFANAPAASQANTVYSTAYMLTS